MRRIYLPFLLLLLLLVACGSRTSLSPTPFPTAGPTSTTSVQGPVVLTVTELAAAPGLYLDTVVQLTGRLRKQPVIVCESDLHLSPADWALAEEGVLALAGGFDQQVRSLLPGDLLMTVEGRWRRWEGLVGCGKQAQQQEVWYLDVGRILSPSPLTQVTLTPGAGTDGTAVAGVPVTIEALATDESSPNPVGTPAETPEPPTPSGPVGGYPAATDDSFSEGLTATLPAELTPATPALNITPTIESTIDPTAGITGTPPTPTTGTPQGTLTPTPTGTPPTQTPTATGGAPGQIVEKGNVFEDFIDDFMTASLEAGKADSWEFELFEEEEMFVYVIAPTPADIILSVVADGQTIINRQNTAPAGAPEILNAPNLPGEGTYQILVEVDGGAATEYGMSVYTDPEFPVIISGIIASGNPRSAVQLPTEGVHLWFFPANAGNNLTVRLNPGGNEDPAADLYGPGAEYIDAIDEGFEGEEEFFQTDSPLEVTGLHALRIIEIYSEPMTYDLELTIQ